MVSSLVTMLSVYSVGLIALVVTGGLQWQDFTWGGSVRRMEHLRSAGNDAFEYGNMGRLDPGGRRPTYTDGAYLAIKLKKSLPNIVLDARRNNSFFSDSALLPIKNSQILSLEGEFDKHFDLRHPAVHQRLLATTLSISGEILAILIVTFPLAGLLLGA